MLPLQLLPRRTLEKENMKLTKKYQTDLAKAIRAAETGKAYHWPTIADILATEIKRLREQEQATELNPTRTTRD